MSTPESKSHLQDKESICHSLAIQPLCASAPSMIRWGGEQLSDRAVVSGAWKRPPEHRGHHVCDDFPPQDSTVISIPGLSLLMWVKEHLLQGLGVHSFCSCLLRVGHWKTPHENYCLVTLLPADFIF